MKRPVELRDLRATVDEINALFPSIYKKYHAQVCRRVAGSDLTFRGVFFLKMLAEQGPVSIGRVARFNHLTSSTVSILAKRLEQKGLIERQRGRSDERRVEVGLTLAGRRFLQQFRPGLEPGLLSLALRRMSKADRVKLLEGLRKLEAVELKEAPARPRAAGGGFSRAPASRRQPQRKGPSKLKLQRGRASTTA